MNCIQEKTYKISDISKTNKNILFKALRQFPIYKFNSLKEYFPLLKSHTEFVSSDNYIGRFEFTIRTEGEPTVVDIYDGVLDVLEKLSYKILELEK